MEAEIEEALASGELRGTVAPPQPAANESGAPVVAPTEDNLEEGTRLYLTLPDGSRAGFTFRPTEVPMLGLPAQLKYYRPAWVADASLTGAWMSIGGGDIPSYPG